MTFGERVRALRKTKGLTLREMAARVGVGFTYLSRVETGRMTYGEYPSADLIRRVAAALGADEEELLLLAEKIPEPLRQRIFERPDAFRRIARLTDKRLDRLLALIDGN
jgi:HTH-type transcriptional regulator, competence development regulator